MNTKPNILIIAENEDVKYFNINRQSNHWNLFWKILDYKKLYESKNEIQDIIKKHDISFILYSRNDQVTNRTSIGYLTKKLMIGYSSFSGIDDNCRIEQMKSCFEDFITCEAKLKFKFSSQKEIYSEISDTKGSYSLIFDTEQLGEARSGLIRILELLNKYNIKVTFFVTNLMKKVYSNIIEEIQAQGHEVGLHGRYHEYISNFSKDEQGKLIENMIGDLSCQIYGANFIGRMNIDTFYALVNNNIKYVVFPHINYYRLFCYPKLTTNPFLVKAKNGEIRMIPISVETYNLPWFSIRNMVDSAHKVSLKSNKHISILLHPFRDGNLQHIEITERLLNYLLNEKKMKSVIIKDLSPSHQIQIEADQINEVNPKLFIGDLIPRTKQDFIGFVPENLILAYKILRKGHTIW